MCKKAKMRDVLAGILMTLSVASLSAQKGTLMTTHARGSFDVKVTPQAQDDAAGGPFSRLFLDKRFHGDLDATSRGQMLASGTGVEGSGAYVALELVTGVARGDPLVEQIRARDDAEQLAVLRDDRVALVAMVRRAEEVVAQERLHGQ